MKLVGNAYKTLIGRLKGKDHFGGLGNKLLLIGETEYSVFSEYKPDITFNSEFM
jgi:hypothetical protein